MSSIDRLKKELGLNRKKEEKEQSKIAVSVLVFTPGGIILVKEPNRTAWKLPGGRGDYERDEETGEIIYDEKTGDPIWEAPDAAAIRELNEETQIDKYGLHVSKDNLRVLRHDYLSHHHSPYWKYFFVVGATVFLPHKYIDAIEHGRVVGEEDKEWIMVVPIEEALGMEPYHPSTNDEDLSPHNQYFLNTHLEVIKPLLEAAVESELFTESAA